MGGAGIFFFNKWATAPTAFAGQKKKSNKCEVARDTFAQGVPDHLRCPLPPTHLLDFFWKKNVYVARDTKKNRIND